MTLKIAATEFVDAVATRLAYRRLGPATVTRLAGAVRFAARGEGAIAPIPEFTLGIYGAKASPTKSAEQSTNPAFETIPRGWWKGYCNESS